MAEELNPEAVRRKRIEAAFDHAEAVAERAQARVVLVALIVIAAWVTWENTFPGVLYYYVYLVAFAFIVAAPVIFAGRRPPRWERFVRLPAATILYTVMVLTPNPLIDDFRTGPMLLRWQNEIYFLLFIVGAAFTYSPAVVIATGVTAATSWSIGALLISHQPGVSVGVPADVWPTLTTAAERRAMILDPFRIFFNGVVRTDIVLVSTACLLATFVHRSRQIVLRQVDAERERANLSRYFSANLVEELAQSDVPLATTRVQDAAVLFIDIAGFTAFSAGNDPQVVIETLRQFHHRVERAVFAHGGTLDKYIGDGAMATFGTPRPGPSDASQSLLCAGALLASLEAWNGERARAGREPIRAGIGVHHGPVVLGDIGGEQRLEFAVVGDTVNVASRLEHLTREVGAALVVSGALIDAIAREGRAPADLLPGLQQAADRSVRGRDEPLRLWIVPL